MKNLEHEETFSVHFLLLGKVLLRDRVHSMWNLLVGRGEETVM